MKASGAPEGRARAGEGGARGFFSERKTEGKIQMILSTDDWMKKWSPVSYSRRRFCPIDQLAQQVMENASSAAG